MTLTPLPPTRSEPSAVVRRVQDWFIETRDPEAPARLRTRVRTTYDLWGLPRDRAVRLGDLAAHLITHARTHATAPTRTLVVYAVHDPHGPDHTKVMVLAAFGGYHGEAPRTGDPATPHADEYGTLNTPVGPALYARLDIAQHSKATA